MGPSFPVFFGLLPHPAAQVPARISTISQSEAMDSLDPPEMQLQLKPFSPPPSPLTNPLSPTQTPHRVSFLSCPSSPLPPLLTFMFLLKLA